jgi:hypothetical protein
MPRIEFILHKGVRILDLDIRGSKDIDQNIAAFRLAQELAIKEPLKSLRLLTDVTEAHFTTEAVSILKEFSKSTTPYMKASAVAGVIGVKWIIIQSLLKLTGRDIKLFDTRENAKEWLAEQ